MTIRLTRRAALGSAAAALAAPRLARAAGKPVSFQFDWKFNAQFAGVFKAIDAGLYPGAGIEMTPRPWADGVNVVADVAEGRADPRPRARPSARSPRCSRPRLTG
jgi:ABC-type nitrate/sulfonate/bicarbonate transport system substrate-binding protein